MKAEHARFLAETRLNERVSFVDIYFTRPGGFVKLLEHVHIHRRLLSQEPGEVAPAGQIRLEDAALDWYENSYCPIIQAIRDRQLLQRFPGRTAADLYVWMWDYILDAYRRLGAESWTPRRRRPCWNSGRRRLSAGGAGADESDRRGLPRAGFRRRSGARIGSTRPSNGTTARSASWATKRTER